MTTLWETAGALARGVWRKTSAWRRSSRLMPGRQPLIVSEEAVKAVRQKALADRQECGKAFEELTTRLMRETAVWNQNNITRTQAYWNVYQEVPELHWALLAHMVSRNGGWSMTDLKGEWLPKLLTDEAANAHFEMLETCNALIFRDAYPQLKLYIESRRLGRPLFGLLPKFGVSSFMQPIWERFWEMGKGIEPNGGAGGKVMAKSESALLTVALIVNEQNVIEEPVILHPHFRDRVLSSASFQAMPLLQTNQIVFPMRAPGERAGRPMKLAGKVLEHFAELHERIEFGKCLYAMLFGYPLVREQVVAFARECPHTGSRADYWPHKFRPAPQPYLIGEAQAQGDASGYRWYSPALTSAWPDRTLPNLPRQDWFREGHRQEAYTLLTSSRPPLVFDMTYEHLLGQRKLQALAKLADGG